MPHYISFGIGSLEKVGLYDNIIEIKIVGCPKNYEVIETEKNVADNIKEGIMSFLGILIFILLIISVAEMIYYGAPTEDLFEP